jgi:hypothetical protein
MNYSLVAVLAVTLILSACGGGGGSSSNGDNNTSFGVDCSNLTTNTQNCYLDYIKLTSEHQSCCDSWIESNKE